MYKKTGAVGRGVVLKLYLPEGEQRGIDPSPDPSPTGRGTLLSRPHPNESLSLAPSYSF